MPQSTNNDYPRVGLVVWHGLPLGTYFRLLRENRFDIALKRWDQAISMGFTGAFNSMLNAVDSLVYGRRVKACDPAQPPLFIVGHWRTGTTLLHELLVRDERFSYPTTYQCMAPGHFLLTQKTLAPLIRFLLPTRRPMDNMPVGWDRPQEDEFGLCNLGVRSPYINWVFPVRDPQDENYLDLTGLTPSQLEAWKDAMLRLVRRLSLKDPRRLVLKSPTHTARIETLLEIFPDAQFVHLVRDPQVLIPSTIHMWKRMGESMGLRPGFHDQVEDHVFDNFHRMNKAWNAQRDLIPPGQCCELRFEDLTADMPGEVERVYTELSLGDFDQVRPAIEQYARDTGDYRRNRFEPPEQLQTRIADECAQYAEQHGYAEAVVS